MTLFSWRCLALAILGLAAVSASASSEGRVDVPPEIAVRKNPETLDESEIRYYARQFKAKCARCHGREGDGGGPESELQSIPPRDLTDAAYMRTRTDGQLFYQILAGGAGRSPMPAFGPGSDQGWSEQKIWHMVAFVRRFSEAPPK